jgi:Sec-independent protein translocase protein TatA
VLDLLVVVVAAGLVLAFLGRRRLPGVARGFGSGIREFRRAKAGLPPVDPGLREDDRSDD